MSSAADPLNDVLQVLKAGEQFYMEGAERTDDLRIDEVFREMANVRTAVIRDLEQKIKAHGDEPKSARWAEQARAFYISAKATLGDRDEVMIEEMEEHEDRTLDAFKDALSETDNVTITAVLEQHMPAFIQTHARMKQLKNELA